MTTERTPKDYRCPTCNAQPGAPCKRPSGHTIPFGDFHMERRDLSWQMEEVRRQNSPEHLARMEGRLF